jgi:hypothetical protein
VTVHVVLSLLPVDQARCFISRPSQSDISSACCRVVHYTNDVLFVDVKYDFAWRLTDHFVAIRTVFACVSISEWIKNALCLRAFGTFVVPNC